MKIEETYIMNTCLNNLLWVKKHKADIIEAAERNEEEFGTHILGMGLCYNCSLSSIHSVHINDELRLYYLVKGVVNDPDVTLLDILFIKYCIETDQPIDTVWPCGPTDVNCSSYNYGADCERWEFLDYMIENLQYILDNKTIKGL